MAARQNVAGWQHLLHSGVGKGGLEAPPPNEKLGVARVCFAPPPPILRLWADLPPPQLRIASHASASWRFCKIPFCPMVPLCPTFPYIYSRFFSLVWLWPPSTSSSRTTSSSITGRHGAFTHRHIRINPPNVKQYTGIASPTKQLRRMSTYTPSIIMKRVSEWVSGGLTPCRQLRPSSRREDFSENHEKCWRP